MSIPLEAIEAAAEALFKGAQIPGEDNSWEELGEVWKEDWRKIAYRALEPAFPHIHSEIEQRLAIQRYEIESIHHIHGNTCTCGFNTGGRARSGTEHILRQLDTPQHKEGNHHDYLNTRTQLEKLADFIAYQRVKETNPKADHHIFGYHKFSKEQRAFLIKQQLPLADAIIKAGWNNQTDEEVRREVANDIYTEEQYLKTILAEDPTDPHLNGVARGLVRARDIAMKDGPPPTATTTERNPLINLDEEEDLEK